MKEGNTEDREIVEEYQAIEDVARNVYGRVMWSHKIQEKQCDIFTRKFTIINIANIVCSALTSAGIVAIIFHDPLWLKVISAVVSFVSALCVLLLKNLNYTDRIIQHKKAAIEYLTVKDRLLLFLLKLHSHKVNLNDMNSELCEIVNSVGEINMRAPITTDSAVKKASKALKVMKDDDITNEEINAGLPPALRR
jgi:hypothetical protein